MGPVRDQIVAVMVRIFSVAVLYGVVFSPMPISGSHGRVHHLVRRIYGVVLGDLDEICFQGALQSLP